MTEGDTKYFFVYDVNVRHKEGEAFDRICRGLSRDYAANKIGGLNGIYSVGDALVEPIHIHKALLVTNFKEGLDSFIENEFHCKLSDGREKGDLNG